MKIAAVNWELRPIREGEEFFTHLRHLITVAASQHSQIVVLPEYVIGEILAILPPYTEEEAPRILVPYAEQYLSELQTLAKKFSITIVGGTYFKALNDSILNVCPIVSPLGMISEQPKNCLVQYEKTVQKISPYAGLHLNIDPNLGVLVCYDSEFPEAARSLCEAGVKILAVPSSTETIDGFHRVRYSCIARAIENQIFVVHAALVGSIGKEPFPTSYGSSAIIAPCMPEIPGNPILSETALHCEGIAYAEIDLSVLNQIRNGGEVQNWNDRSQSTWNIIS